MKSDCVRQDEYEITSRFRHMIEERIARLERDAASDEMQAALLVEGDHIRRQMRLVAVQRAEALRMRLFLERARTSSPPIVH
jgi:ribosome-associated translation inhibitor RaiA